MGVPWSGILLNKSSPNQSFKTGIDFLTSFFLLFFSFCQVRKSANSTLLYLIENGFLDKKVINRTVCPVILDLLKIDKTDGVNGEYDIQLNAIGVSLIVRRKFCVLVSCEIRLQPKQRWRHLRCLNRE